LQGLGFVGLRNTLRALLSLLLPRPWFVALFKIAYPWMPDKLE
jgi:hypothetical protein